MSSASYIDERKRGGFLMFVFHSQGAAALETKGAWSQVGQQVHASQDSAWIKGTSTIWSSTAALL